MRSNNILSILLLISTAIMGQDQITSLKFYGFIRNDFFYNSRKNEEGIDGSFNLIPKAIEMSSGSDKNAVPQAQLMSVNTRLGVDIVGKTILGAKSSAKIEGDFAGAGTTTYQFRLRDAYLKLEWERSELKAGQDWHPLFGSVAPTVLSFNNGAPFQPLSLCPHLKFKYTLKDNLSVSLAAIYETQFASQGPNGVSTVYKKNAILPELFLGMEQKSEYWTIGAAFDLKTIKLDANSLLSKAVQAYGQYVHNGLQIKLKSTYGQNLTDLCMIGGYGVSKYASDSVTVLSYTNLNTLSSWFNIVCGNKIQVGLLVGYAENIGSQDALAYRKGRKLTTYGYGFYDSSQQLIRNLMRISPHMSYTLSNLKFGVEIDYTRARYGTGLASGRVSSPYDVDNKRIVAIINYIIK